MAETWRQLSDAFWSAEFWFYDNVTWKDFENVPGGIYLPQMQDLNWALPLGVVLLFVRYYYERIIITPVARYFGIKDRRQTVQAHPVLEEAYTRNGRRITTINVKDVSKKTDMSVREVERWFHRRKQIDAHSTLMKFRECSWHFLFYLCSFAYGMLILWDRNWFWDIKYCVIGWPKLHIDQPMYMFYLVEMAFYWSLLFSSFTDVKRKDFAETIIHHVITMFLIYFSWTFNYARYGAIIMVLHDAADYWMAGAKMAKYSKCNKLSEFLFVCFLVVWLITRTGLYPFWVLRFIIMDTKIVKPSSVRTFLTSLLCGLMVLHVIWTYLILRIVFHKLLNGTLSDVRSDSESGEEEPEEEKEEDNSVQNQTSTSGIQNGFSGKTKTKH